MIRLAASICVASTLLALPVAAQDTLLDKARVDRTRIAGLFAEQAASCVARRDTRHDAFHGCVDWHSAVHGVWALVAYTRFTGDRRHEPLIRTVLQGEKLEVEAALLKLEPSFEMPYGRAWLLRLVIEYEELYGDGLMLPIGDLAADSLRAHYRGQRPQWRDPDYDNPSWAFANLLDYARFRKQADVERELLQEIERSFYPSINSCYDDGRGFMAICLNRARLLSKTKTPDEFKSWVAVSIRKDRLPPPVVPQGAHSYGMNFSRAWSLWDIAAASGEPAYLVAYARHFKAGFEPHSNWNGDYMRVGHWVAQFGMFALRPLLVEDRK